MISFSGGDAEHPGGRGCRQCEMDFNKTGKNQCTFVTKTLDTLEDLEESDIVSDGILKRCMLMALPGVPLSTECASSLRKEPPGAV